MGVVISCVGHLHSNSWRANLFEVRPLIINSFYFPHFKAALMLFEVRSLLEVLGYLNCSGLPPVFVFGQNVLGRYLIWFILELGFG